MAAPRLFELVVTRQRRVFAVVAAVAFLLACIVTFALPKVYRADATLFVGANRSITAGAGAVQLDEQLARTYVSLVRTPAVSEGVSQALPFHPDPSSLDGNLDVEVTSGTRLIRLRAYDGDPDRARQIADAYATTFVAQQRAASADATSDQLDALKTRIRKLSVEIQGLKASTAPAEVSRRAVAETELASARDAYVANQRSLALQGSNLTVASQAVTPTSPDRPRPKLYLALGLFLALALGATAAALADRFDDRMRDEVDLEELLGAPVLARIPTERAGQIDAVREACDVLCTNLRAGKADVPRSVIAVTSTLPAEGKTFVTTRLAAGFASMGVTVVAVDCDLRKRTLSSQLGGATARGVANLLVGNGRAPNEVLTETPMMGVHLLASGPPMPNPAAMLATDRMADVLTELSGSYSEVIVDTAPVMVGGDTTALADAVDGVLVVVDLDIARRRTLKDTVARLARAGTPIVGIALNRVRAEPHLYYATAGEVRANGRAGRTARQRADAR